ncbi:MAG: gephyrin-like molybdotransferase Glp [Pseudomonadota bacterium]
MISVSDALSQIFALVAPLGTQTVPVDEAIGRVLAEPGVAQADQPPFASSAMDGYAVVSARPGETLVVIGEAAAGARFDGVVAAGEAVRIFTGAPVPQGATRIVIQEDVTRVGDRITLNEPLDPAAYIRPAGGDFQRGDTVTAPRVISPVDAALLAAMQQASVSVRRRPEVALIATGDELVAPGERPGPDQIVSTNSLALAGMIEAAGGIARRLPIARDKMESLDSVFALAAGADLIVTLGGASVGDHDLVRAAGATLGLEQSFYKVAMRPGKPLMAGTLDGVPVIGLPGNPVSAVVCAMVFVVPALRVMLGFAPEPVHRVPLPLATAVPANGPREHYMRATLTSNGVVVEDRQDSSLLSVLARADALVVRPPRDPARAAGDLVDVIHLRSR